MKTSIAIVAVAGLAAAASAQQLVANEDFDGGATNLISSSFTNQDGGPGDFFGVGSTGSWPQSAGVPFSLADDSAIDVSGGTRTAANNFPGDTEGVFGQNRNVNDNFFGISDSDQLNETASWTFDVSGFTDLQLAVDFGGISNSSFGGFSSQSVNFEVILDGNSLGNAIRFDATSGTFTTRPMDNGAASGGGGLLLGSGDFGLTKFDAVSGLSVADTFSDKATVAGGELDTFLSGVFSASGGSTLEVVLTADMPFEAAAFDNLEVRGVPTPGAAALLGLGGLAAARRRRA